MPITYDTVWTGPAGGNNLWTTAANWTGAAQPAIGNDISIPAGTGPIDCTGMADRAFGEVHIQKGYRGNTSASGAPGAIGSSGVRWVASSTKFVNEGEAKVWFGAGAGATALIENAAPRSTIDSIDISGSNITRVVLLRGRANTATSGATIARLDMSYIANRDSDVTLTMEDSANAITTLIQDGGLLVSDRLITLFQQFSGSARQQGTRAITTAEVAGQLVYITSGTLGQGRVMNGGTLNLRGTPEFPRILIATVSALDIYPGGEWIDHPALITYTVDRNDWRHLLEAP